MHFYMHRIKGVSVDVIDHQYETGSFVRKMTIESEDGDLEITLFSDNKDNLVVTSDTRTLE